jgi:hypothetical protein
MMQYKLLSKIAPQCNSVGFAEHLNLSNFQSESLQIPGFGKIANMSTFYLPLRGSTSPYQQNKKLQKDEKVAPKIETESVKTETLPITQTGFGQSDLVLENLNQAQKHKLEDNVYSAMTNPVIKIKKMKFDPSTVLSQVKPETKTNIQSEPMQIKKIGKGSKKLKSAHIFSVI